MKQAILIIGFVVLAVVALSRQNGPAIGAQAPSILAKDASGREQSLATLTKNGPVFLYFIKHDCPVNAQAVPFYVRLHEAYKGKARLVGVINGNKETYDQWNARFRTPFPVLLDPGKKIISAYGAERSPWVVMVGKDGKVAKVWKGYSTDELTQIGNEMAKSGGTKVAKLDFTGAPSEAAYG